MLAVVSFELLNVKLRISNEHELAPYQKVRDSRESDAQIRKKEWSSCLDKRTQRYSVSIYIQSFKVKTLSVDTADSGLQCFQNYTKFRESRIEMNMVRRDIINYDIRL